MRFDHKIFIKKALKLTDAEKTQIFENFVRGRSRQDLTESCLGHLGPSLIPHPSPILVFIDNFVRPKMASREPWVQLLTFSTRRLHSSRNFSLQGLCFLMENCRFLMALKLSQIMNNCRKKQCWKPIRNFSPGSVWFFGFLDQKKFTQLAANSPWSGPSTLFIFL